MVTVQNLKKFCNNMDTKLLESFPQIIKKMFLKYAYFCKQKYNKTNKYTRLANIILSNLVYNPDPKRGKVYSIFF